MSASFESPQFQLDKNLAQFFAQNLDGNPVHLEGRSNLVMPAGTVPGLMVMALASKALLQLPEFKEVQCAKGFTIQFVEPAFVGQSLKVRGTFVESTHRKRPELSVRTNRCEVVCVETNRVVVRYEIIQLVASKVS